MKTTNDQRRNKHFVLNQSKLKRAQRVLGARTETEAIERALDQVIDEDERNRSAWSATERLLKSRVQVRDVFGRLKD